MRRFAALLVVLGMGACDGDPEAPAPIDVEGRVSGTGASGLRVREGPSTATAQTGTLAEGARVTVVCRAEGEAINGNKFWDRIEEEGGGFVADAYIDMGGAEKSIPRCPGLTPAVDPPPSAPGPGGPPASVDIQGPTVRPHVQAFADAACGAVAACRASTYRGHQPVAELALDFPTGEDYGKLPTDGHAFGDRLAEFALAGQREHRIEYVIYRQRINSGDGWRTMDDRGSITQNHFDHVHVSFEP